MGKKKSSKTIAFEEYKARKQALENWQTEVGKPIDDAINAVLAVFKEDEIDPEKGAVACLRIAAQVSIDGCQSAGAFASAARRVWEAVYEQMRLQGRVK